MKRMTFVVLPMLLVVGCLKKNHAPDAPSTPSGPTAVEKDSLARFWSSAADVDGDSVSIRFDWGDGDTSGWTDWDESGSDFCGMHRWDSTGTYLVRAQAQDERGAVSVWSDPAEIAVLGYWCRTYGGEEREWGYAGLQTSDLGYILLGDILVGGFLLIRTDSQGDTVWTRRYGDDVFADGYAIVQTQDGGYVVVGTAFAAPMGNDIYVVRIDGSGNALWARTYDRADWDMGYSVVLAGDGGFMVAGFSGLGSGDVCLLRLDANGDTLWTRAYAGAFPGQAPCYGMDRTDDNGYAVVANKRLGGDDLSAWLIRTDANGDTLWTRVYEGVYAGFSRSVRQTSDRGYVILTDCGTMTGGRLVRTDHVGDTLWTRSFEETLWPACTWLEETDDQGFIVTGAIGDLDDDVLLMKLDPQGVIDWCRSFGGDDRDWGHHVQQTSDGGFVVVGLTESFGAIQEDIILIKCDPFGRLLSFDPRLPVK